MFKYKNICMIISVALAILCLIFMIYSFCNASTGVNSVDSAESVGTAIGMALVAPCLVAGGVGTILHTVGGCVYKRGLVLAGVICECVSVVLMITWGMFYIPAIILGFIGYAKMPRKI